MGHGLVDIHDRWSRFRANLEDIPAEVVVEARELWTVLAALRFFQQCRLGQAENQPRWINEVATNGGEVPALNDERIDLLCERLNGADVIRVDYARRAQTKEDDHEG